MVTIFEIKKLALDLPEQDRATLAASLLESLPPILSGDDEGISEAMRRDAELDADPGQAISFAQLDSQIRNRCD
jgi:putative addiction module component (TIGR02574 family)